LRYCCSIYKDVFIFTEQIMRVGEQLLAAQADRWDQGDRQTHRQMNRWTDGAGDIVIDRTEIYTEI
jgi:hypothetical protein